MRKLYVDAYRALIAFICLARAIFVFLKMRLRLHNI